MLKRFFVFLMAFSLLSAHLAQAMSSDDEDFHDHKSSKVPPPLGRDEGLDFQDKAFLGITFTSLIAALFVVYKYKPY